TMADHGGNIVATPQLYGTTHTLLNHVLRRQGIEARFAASDDPADIDTLIDSETRAVFCESVDNPVATPVLLRPIEYGADIVVHSLTKFMGGHGAAMGGIVVDAGRFDW